MANILQEIYNHKLQEVRFRKKQNPVSKICEKINCNQIKPLDFAQALRLKIAQNQNALICEVKKASPSKGIIREDFIDEKDAIKFAKIYQEAGACAISVLTDEKYFQGCDKYLQAIRACVKLPILRKDFIVDSYQIYESKMLGADCILLIVAMIDEEKLIELEEIALKAGLSVLVEVHSEKELQKALKLQTDLIGINNRNLTNFQTNVNTSIELSKQIPENKIIIAESAINDKKIIEILNQNNINSFLIGEYFMRQNDIKKAVQEFL